MGRQMLDQIKIAAPCPASWSSMEGDDKVRYCGLCKLNVYNISDMSRSEAEAFIARSEGRTCIRMFQRVDGKVLTRNCPVGVAALYRKVARAAILTVVFVLSGFGVAMASLRGKSSDTGAPVTEQIRDWPVVGPLIDKISPRPMMGEIAVPVLMGKPSTFTHPTTPKAKP